MNENSGGEHRRILWGAGTPRTMRAHWILHEVGLRYERKPIGPRTGETQTPEFTKLNPKQKIPVLQDGDFILSESAAIVTYLAEVYGDKNGLVPPPATRQRAEYYQWAFFTMMELDAHTTYVIRKHVALKEIYGEAPNAVRAAIEGYAKQACAVDMALSQRGPFILGETFTGADILLTTCLSSAQKYDISFTQAVHEYLGRTTSREAYQNALQANKNA